MCGHNVGKRPTLGWLTQNNIAWASQVEATLHGLHPRKLTLN